MSENHILYTLGHQSLLLKDHYTAASLFNELVATTNVGMNPLQQMCHLREFFIVHHMREKEDNAYYIHCKGEDLREQGNSRFKGGTY